jgi:hypothetical protein
MGDNVDVCTEGRGAVVSMASREGIGDRLASEDEGLIVLVLGLNVLPTKFIDGEEVVRLSSTGTFVRIDAANVGDDVREISPFGICVAAADIGKAEGTRVGVRVCDEGNDVTTGEPGAPVV